MLAATIRHVEAAAVDACNRRQLVHELERDLLSGPRWYERLRVGKAGSAPALAASFAPLAGDYQQLAEEVIARLADAESQSASETVLQGGAA